MCVALYHTSVKRVGAKKVLQCGNNWDTWGEGDVYCVVCHSSTGEHRHREGKCILVLVVCLSSWKLYTRGDGVQVLQSLVLLVS